MESVGVYIHVPFCTKKCGYCDFNAYSGYKSASMSRYADALCAEIRAHQDKNTAVPTVFFGGGTPSLLPAADLARILQAVRESFAVEENAEISLEANPSDAAVPYLSELRRAGFNRVSLGVQTFNDRLLKTLDRIHSAHDAQAAVANARVAGFDNISIDLMFALPRQTLADFDRSLTSAFALDIAHISIYSLIVEENTRFHVWREAGKLPLPTHDTEAAMFARAIERAEAAGFRQYEVSNYARPGHESRHNAIYWRNEAYHGFGAGAFGYVNGARRMNEKLPNKYADKVFATGNAIVSEEILTVAETMGETMMTSLRMTAGICESDFAARFGRTVSESYPDVVAEMTARGWLESAEGHIRLTRDGLFFASDVMAAFLSEPG